MHLIIVGFKSAGRNHETKFIDKSYLQIHEDLIRIYVNYQVTNIIECKDANFELLTNLTQFQKS